MLFTHVPASSRHGEQENSCVECARIMASVWHFFLMFWTEHGKFEIFLYGIYLMSFSPCPDQPDQPDQPDRLSSDVAGCFLPDTVYHSHPPASCPDALSLQRCLR